MIENINKFQVKCLLSVMNVVGLCVETNERTWPGSVIMEKWKDIFGWEGLYKVSDFGRIKSLRKNKIMNPGDNGHGYKFVNLKYNNSSQRFYVHRLVAILFIPNEYNKNEVNHIDFDKSNNHKNNLEWLTTQENRNHAKLNNRYHCTQYQKEQISKANSGVNSHLSILNDADVIEIRRLYKGGLTQKQISILYNVCRATIGYITSNNTWKHLL